MSNNKIVYLDNAATTQLSRDVIESMLHYMGQGYGNPSSLYSIGRESKKAIKKAREQVAKAINANPSQIFFTSGATESNTWVCQNFQWVICSPIEHHSVFNQPNTEPISADELESKIQSDELMLSTELASYMMVNNEIGYKNDIKNLCKLLHEIDTSFHTDATQAFGHEIIDVQDLDVDYLSMSGHKFYAPKGVGILYAKNPNTLSPMLYGGHQESGLRAGTENVTSIVAMGQACELFDARNEEMQKVNAKISTLKNHLKNFIANNFEDYLFNEYGGDEKQSDNILSVSFKGLEAESIMLMLDSKGICVGAGSACNSGSLEASHVLTHFKVPQDYIHGTIRFSFGMYNTLEEIFYVEEQLKDVITKLRSM